MKILIGVHHFLPRYTGGAEGQAYRLAKTLILQGNDVQVFCVERIDSGSQPGLTWVDDIFDTIPVRRLFYNQRLFPVPALFEYDNVWIGEHLSHWLQEIRPDLFHLIGGYLLSGRVLRAAREQSVPTVVSVMDFWFLCPRISMLKSDGSISGFPIDPIGCVQCLAETQRRYRLPGKVLPGLMRKYWETQKIEIQKIQARSAFLKDSLNGVDRIISNSHFLMQMLTQSGIQSERMIYLRQGRDFPGLNCNLDKHPSEKLRIAYIGQIAELKGVHIILEALRNLPDQPIELKIYGDTDPFPQYVKRLKNLASSDPRIEFSGVFHGYEEETRILNQVDVLIVPSLWYENSPNVILEAFAHRVPVIASNLGGMAELVQHESNGLLFTVGDPEDLSRQVKRFFTEPELLEKLRSGISPVQTVAEEIEKTVSVYTQVIQSTFHIPQSF